MFGFLKNSRQVTESELESIVGCLGKLPIYAEFIRHNVTGRSVIDLDEWVQQGFSHHSRGMQVSDDKPKLHSYTYNYVFSGNSELSSTVIGTMMGSRDKSGRQYPFMLFKMLANKNTESLTSAIPCAYEKFFSSAHKLCTTDWSLQPITMLKKRVDALYPGVGQVSRCDLMESELASLQAITCNHFWRQTLGESAEQMSPYYVEVMHDLLVTVARKSPLRTSWGIEIPLPAKDQTHKYVTFWVRLAETVLGDREWRAHYIWGDINNSEKQSLYLFFRPISPTFFSHLLGNRVNNGVLINLEQECVRQKSVSDKAHTIGDLNVKDDLVGLVNHWANWSQG